MNRCLEKGSQADYDQIKREEIDRIKVLEQLGATTAALMTKADVAAASDAAANAIENNFVFAVMPVIMGAMKLYDILTTCAEAWEAYEKGGPAALVEYGLEEATANLLMGSSMKIVGKMVSKAKTVVKETLGKSGPSFKPHGTPSHGKGPKAPSQKMGEKVEVKDVNVPAPIKVPGRVQSRINLRKGDGTNDNPGIISAWRKHGDPTKTNKSQFTISQDEVISILEAKTTVNVPVKIDPNTGAFVREVDVGKVIGRLPEQYGGSPTNSITILTDKQGNLVNVFPGPLNYIRK